MSFSAFSKDFTANMFTSVENQFITKYLPQADGDAVRAYLYGLYLCQCKEEFDAESAAKLLGLPLKRLVDIFGFWEECDLVHILSRDPLFVEYLPVNAAVGKPKPIRPEKYAQFNREFYKLLQKAGKDFKPYEMQRILEFLENYPMEQQAFLLVTEYCVKKDCDKLTSSHILNKAAQLCRDRKYTYEQAEEYFSDFNLHEKELSRIFTLLGIYRKALESDYDFLDKWTNWGMEMRAVYAGAEYLKNSTQKGTLATLDRLIEELHEKNAHTEKEAREYLARRAELVDIVFKIAKKLGVKVQNPIPYAEEYCEKWLEHGYDADGLVLLAGLGLKLGYGFAELDTLLDNLYRDGVVDGEGLKAYCAQRDKEFKLLQSVQSLCGVVKNPQTALDMIATWRSWGFSDAMILEAAGRSTTATAPLSYINKLLSEWKRVGAFSPSEIPERAAAPTVRPDYRTEAAIAADERGERERYYAILRQHAETKADAARTRAMQDEEFSLAETSCRKLEIELARAELFSPEKAEAVKKSLADMQKKRSAALLRLNLTERDLTAQPQCPKCSDTGFLPDGRMCDCYKK